MHAPRPIVLFAFLTIALSSFAQVDVTPPNLTALSFSSNSVDVTAASATLTILATVTDDLSGFSNPVSYFESTSFQRAFCVPQLVSGSPQNGVYSCTVTIPRFAESGIWRLNLVLQDAVGNHRFLDSGALQLLGLPSIITVSSISDLAGPQVTGLGFTPALVDVSAGPRAVTVDVGLSDSPAGVVFQTNFALFLFVMRSPSGRQRLYAANQEFNFQSGNQFNGVWRTTLVVNRYSEPGNWTVDSAEFRDSVGNLRTYDSAQLAALGIQPTFTVVSAPADTIAPVLTGLNFNPAFVNTTTSSQAISVGMQVTDDLSGVSFAPTNPFASLWYGVVLVSPSGSQIQGTNPFSGIPLTSGNALNGLWTGTIHLPRISEAGTWRILFLDLRDTVLNTRHYEPADLAVRGFPTSIEVIQPSGSIDGFLGPAGGSVQDQVFGDRAKLIFPAGLLSVDTSVSIDVLQTPPSIPIPMGFASASFFVNIELSPHPPAPLNPPGALILLPLSRAIIPGTRLPLFRVNPATATLERVIGFDGNPVEGFVLGDGITAVFFGILSFSTVVGLERAPLTITTASLPPAQVGVPYSFTLSASGGLPPYRWGIVNGRLPAGLTFNPATGEIAGMLTVEHVPMALTFEVSDGSASTQRATAALEFRTGTNSLRILQTSLPNGRISWPYEVTLQAAGGTPPYHWEITTTGTLPPGLTLNPLTGQISGFPLTPINNAAFVVRVTDESAPVPTSATAALRITVE